MQQLRTSARPSRIAPAQRRVAAAAKTSDGPRLAIVGVTGAVGQEFLRVRRLGVGPAKIYATSVPHGAPSRRALHVSFEPFHDSHP
jgi:hypothetical protein